MIALVLVFCLASDPTACREERYPGIEPEHCVDIVPQLLAAEWLREHVDGWTFAGSRCEVALDGHRDPT